MFEIIGMIFIGWIVWAILRGMIKGSIKGTLSRAVEYAAIRGVSRTFSWKVLEDPDIIKAARDRMARYDSDFAALDTYEQYGRALIALYKEAGFETNQEI